LSHRINEGRSIAVPGRTTFETRAENELSGNRLVGYASVFSEYSAQPGHLEAIGRGAFNDVLDGDTLALWNHNMDYVLARTASGTLKLSTDSTGLHYELELPDTQYARDLRVLVERGDVRGSSFGFIPGEDEWTTRARRRIRIHTRIARLIDVSPVAMPAYGSTTVSVRNEEDNRARLLRARMKGFNLNG